MIYTEAFPIQFAPIARAEAVVLGPHIRFTVLSSRLIRCEYSPTACFEDRPSQVFWYRQQPVPDFEVRREAGLIEIETDHLLLRYRPTDGGFSADSLLHFVERQRRRLAVWPKRCAKSAGYCAYA